MRSALLILFALLIAGRAVAEPFDRTMIVNGELIYTHVDYKTNPCKSDGPRGGCFAIVNANKHIWYQSKASYTFTHEMAHAKHGMRHTEWEYGPRGAWAIVTVAAPGYPLGSTIFDNGYREFVF